MQVEGEALRLQSNMVQRLQEKIVAMLLDKHNRRVLAGCFRALYQRVQVRVVAIALKT